MVSHAPYLLAEKVTGLVSGHKGENADAAAVGILARVQQSSMYRSYHCVQAEGAVAADASAPGAPAASGAAK